MKPLAPRVRTVCLSCAASVLATVVLIDLAAAQREADVTARQKGPPVTLSEGTAEIKFSAPKRYAVLLHAPNKIKRLYTSGDVLFHPHDPTRSGVIERVDAGGMVLGARGKGRERSVRPGRPVPGFPGVMFVGTVMLNHLEYRFKVVDRVTQTEPVLVSLVGYKAVLEKEVLYLPPDLVRPAPKRTSPPTSRQKLDAELFQKVRVKEVDGHTYELEEATLKPVIENVEQVLADLEPRLTPAFSFQTGMSLNFKSRAGDGTLSRSGFTVTRLPVARTFGIEVGDTIISLNGRQVNSPRNAWWTFQELFIRNRSLTELRVNLIRGGRLMTKTFRIR